MKKKDRRDKVIKVRVSEDELSKFTILAKKYGISTSKLIRLLVESQFDVVYPDKTMTVKL